MSTADERFLSPGLRAMFASVFSFALANLCVKYLTHLPPLEIVFFRCILGILFCYIGLRRAGADWRGSNRTLLFLRGAFGTSALVLFFITVQNIPLASATTLQYTSPIFTAIFAIFILGEKLLKPQWLFFAIAFGGVLLMGQFDSSVSPFYLVIGLLSAAGSGVAYNLVRSLRGAEHPLTVVFHFQFLGAVVGFFSLFFDWKLPQGPDWFFIVLLGIFSQLGQIFLTKGMQNEPAAGAAIINYSGLVYALVFGALLFGESPSAMSFAGMLLVVVGVLLSVIYSKRRRDLEKIESTIA